MVTGVCQRFYDVANHPRLWEDAYETTFPRGASYCASEEVQVEEEGGRPRPSSPPPRGAEAKASIKRIAGGNFFAAFRKVGTEALKKDAACVFSHIVRSWHYESRLSNRKVLLVESPLPDGDGVAHATIRHMCCPFLHDNQNFRLHLCRKRMNALFIFRKPPILLASLLRKSPMNEANMSAPETTPQANLTARKIKIIVRDILLQLHRLHSVGCGHGNLDACKVVLDPDTLRPIDLLDFFFGAGITRKSYDRLALDRECLGISYVKKPPEALLPASSEDFAHQHQGLRAIMGGNGANQPPNLAPDHLVAPHEPDSEDEEEELVHQHPNGPDHSNTNKPAPGSPDADGPPAPKAPPAAPGSPDGEPGAAGGAAFGGAGATAASSKEQKAKALGTPPSYGGALILRASLLPRTLYFQRGREEIWAEGYYNF